MLNANRYHKETAPVSPAIREHNDQLDWIGR